MSLTDDAVNRMSELVGGDSEVLADIMTSFVEEADVLCAQMLSSAGKGDLAGLGRAAHSIKSSARDFGDDDLAALCAALEHASKAETVADPLAAAEAIIDACRVLQGALSAYVQQKLSGAVQ